MKTGYFGRLFILATGLFFLSLGWARSNTVYVGWDSDRGFSPNSVTINVGDTVAWVNNDSIFSTQVTSDNTFGQPNFFQFTLVSQDDVAEVTFNTAGTIGYSETFGGSGQITINQVAAVTITLSSPRLSGGAFLFDAVGLTASKTNVLEVSTDFTHWTAMATNIAAGSSMIFTNSVGAGAQFYRVVQLP